MLTICLPFDYSLCNLSEVSFLIPIEQIVYV